MGLAKPSICDSLQGSLRSNIEGDALRVSIRYWLAIVMHFSFELDFSPNLGLYL